MNRNEKILNSNRKFGQLHHDYNRTVLVNIEEARYRQVQITRKSQEHWYDKKSKNEYRVNTAATTRQITYQCRRQESIKVYRQKENVSKVSRIKQNTEEYGWASLNVRTSSVKRKLPPIDLASKKPCSVNQQSTNVNFTVNIATVNKILTQVNKIDSNVQPKQDSFQNKKPEELFKSEELNNRRSSAIKALYSGKSCSNCSIRFGTDETTKYTEHLDYHFRQNRREREMKRKLNSRHWYPKLSDWMQYMEIEYTEDRKQSFFEMVKNNKSLKSDQNVRRGSTKNEVNDEPTVTADVGQHSNDCYMCTESFEMFFNDDLDEWQLRNAVKYNNILFHPICLQDYSKNIKQNSENLEK